MSADHKDMDSHTDYLSEKKIPELIDEVLLYLLKHLPEDPREAMIDYLKSTSENKGL